ncbi:RNA polymerase I-associated factor PAF67-domain-containing protein [Pilobolus umbonatus]|nr:RNA polymerase I-associated factor PAF67-domain-containing protein [Pilobolus umbonatus]
MYQDTFEDDDLIAEVELVAQARYSRNDDIDDNFDVEVTSNQANTTQIPDPVRNFILHFYRNVMDNNVYELHNIYDSSFNKLTEKYYQKQAWPEAEVISPLVNDDQVFLTLYRELYYRHVYSYLTPTLEHRFHSYENYCDLFNYILNSEEPVSLELPNQWLWDIIDEFIYQFQSFCNYRDRVKNRTEQEAALLSRNSQIWSCYSVLNVLYSFIQKSRINEQLLVSKNGGDMMEAAGEYGSRPLYKMLGYFSIIGLLRVHCLLGDYILALKMMDNIVLNKKAMFARVTACHVTTYYYVGFAYMMIRRYADAIKAFSTVLSFIQRTKQYHSRSYQFDQIAKKGDQMYALLAICIALCPTRLDENIHSQLREKYGEQLFKMQKGEESLSIYLDLFQFACPKFLSPSGKGVDPHQNQVKVFIADIANQINLPILRSIMKLYTTMGIDKLAKFLEVDSEELKTQLLIFKQKSRQYKWVEGNLLEGEYLSTSDLDFCLKQDVVHIAESKVGRRYGDWFLRNINRCEDILANLELSKA